MNQAVVLQNSDPVVKSVFRRLNLEGPTAGSLAIGTAMDMPYPADAIWTALEQLDTWGVWSRPLHSRARWLEKRQFEVGARFEQVRHFGFPIGRQVTVETVREVVPSQMVAWWDGNGGVRNAHLWSLEQRGDGTTRVYNVEVLCGPLMLVAKPLLVRRLRKRFCATLIGLRKRLESA